MRFSVVICAFNVARFLEKSIKNLMNQSFADFEVILVDDGSTDGITPALCDKVAETDSRIKVIHQKNGGLGAARNAGIETATGDYICFYDVDDVIHDNALEVINKNLTGDDTDVFMFSYTEISPEYGITYPCVFNKKTLKGDEIKECYPYEFSGVRFNNGFAWNKAYNRKFLIDNNLRFGNQAIQQDEVFNLRVYREARKIILSDEILYDYYVYNSGNNRSRYIPDRLELYKAIQGEFFDIKYEWNINNIDFDIFICTKHINSFITALTYNLFHKDCPLDNAQKRNVIREAFEDKDLEISVLSLQDYHYRFSSLITRLYFKAICTKSVSRFIFTMRLANCRDFLASCYRKLKRLLK